MHLRHETKRRLELNRNLQLFIWNESELPTSYYCGDSSFKFILTLQMVIHKAQANYILAIIIFIYKYIKD